MDIQQFTDEQRQMVVREIARHRKEAEEIGYRRGRAEGIDVFIRKLVDSWTLRGSLAGGVLAIAAASSDTVLLLLQSFGASPEAVGLISAVFAFLRLRGLIK